MIKIISGRKGSGKTKTLIDMVNTAVQASNGNVVCIEKGMQLTFEIDHRVRLIVADEYHIQGYDAFYGFVAGVLAGNYDIKDVFVDGILKIGNRDLVGLGEVLKKIDDLIKDDVTVVITVSADEAELPDTVKKYL